MEREPGTVVPTLISKEAWEAAFTIDAEIDQLFTDYGLRRREGHTKLTDAIARLVQLSINRAFDSEIGHG